LSIWQGPAMSTSGRALPKRTEPAFTTPFGSTIRRTPERDHGAEARRRRNDDPVFVALGVPARIVQRLPELDHLQLERREKHAATRVGWIQVVARAKIIRRKHQQTLLCEFGFQARVNGTDLLIANQFPEKRA